MKQIQMTINGKALQVPAHFTILQAAKQAGIHLPTLCYLKDLNEIGACRVCVVEVAGRQNLAASCVQPVEEGMEVLTNSARVRKARQQNLQLVLSNHDQKCLSCTRSGGCELQSLSREYGLTDTHYYKGENPPHQLDESAIHMVRDNNKCILCRRCVAACTQNQGVGVIGPNHRGFATTITCAFEQGLAHTPCISCGQCITVCPTGALYEKDDSQKAWAALEDKSKYVIAQTAPSVRVAVGESFGLPIGTNCQGKMVAALKALGVNEVFDTNFGADLTIVEEANEFLHRYQKGEHLPMLTSCSPGWVQYLEQFYPQFIPNLSSCKSPQQMLGATVKSYYAQKLGKNPADIVIISVMPCTAKKFEITRDGQAANGTPDVDIVLTTREFARMVNQAGLDFPNLPEEEFDTPLGISSGAGLIFGASGGVMEAALRTACEAITGTPLQQLEFREVRGVSGLKEASYTLGDVTLKVAAVSGTANAGALLDRIQKGEVHYDFVEVMACPGGCIGGGGQPIQPASVRNNVDVNQLRASALYAKDGQMQLRKSHENPAIKQLYQEFLGEIGGERAHHLLHTNYVARDAYALPTKPKQVQIK